MRYQRANPRPFLPRGMEALEVLGCPPMVRMVTTRLRAKNNDLAIVTIHPLLEMQVTFQAIHEVVSDFLHERGIKFKSIQPLHLG
jgi:hypothetical protein